MDFFWFIWFGVCSASWFFRFVSLAKFGKFSVIISRMALSAPPPFCPSGTQLTYMFDLLLGPWDSIHFFSNLFSLLFQLGNFCCSILWFVVSSLSCLFCCWAHPLRSSFWLLYLSRAASLLPGDCKFPTRPPLTPPQWVWGTLSRGEGVHLGSPLAFAGLWIVGPQIFFCDVWMD